MTDRNTVAFNISESPHLTPITRTSVTDEIVKRLIGMILDAGLRPGDKLPSERELMGRLAVGRSSLREAIKVLSAVGVIEVSVGEGMFVGRGDNSVLTKPLSWGLLIGQRSTAEVIEARRVVETEMAALAAERATEGEVKAISQCLDGMRRTMDDPESYSGFDLEFHEAVARAAHNDVLFQVLETLRHVVQLWIVKVHEKRADKDQSFAQHVPVYEAIRARDTAAARVAMGAHLDSASERLMAVMQASSGAVPSEAR